MVYRLFFWALADIFFYQTSSNLENKEESLTSEINTKTPVCDNGPHLSLLHEIVTNTKHSVLRKTCALL